MVIDPRDLLHDVEDLIVLKGRSIVLSSIATSTAALCQTRSDAGGWVLVLGGCGGGVGFEGGGGVAGVVLLLGGVDGDLWWVADFVHPEVAIFAACGDDIEPTDVVRGPGDVTDEVSMPG